MVKLLYHPYQACYYVRPNYASNNYDGLNSNVHTFTMKLN
jgi:hypothetical protein